MAIETLDRRKFVEATGQTSHEMISRLINPTEDQTFSEHLCGKGRHNLMAVSDAQLTMLTNPQGASFSPTFNIYEQNSTGGEIQFLRSFPPKVGTGRFAARRELTRMKRERGRPASPK